MSSMATGNGWVEYQRLVLAELERLNEGLKSLETRAQTISLAQELGKQQVLALDQALKENRDRMDKKFDDLGAQVKGLQRQADSLELTRLAGGISRKHWKLILAGVIGFSSAVVFPALNFFFG